MISASLFAPSVFRSCSSAKWQLDALCCSLAHASASWLLYPVFVFAPARVKNIDRCSSSKNARLPIAFFCTSVGVSTSPTIGTIYAAVTSFSALSISDWSIRLLILKPFWEYQSFVMSLQK